MIIPKASRLDHVQEYYFARKLAEVRALNAKGKNIINLGIGDPDQAPSEASVKELIASASNPAHHGYQPYRSVPALRQAMSEWYGRVYKVSLNPETEVLPLMGSKEGVFHISMAFLNPGDKVLVPDPGYPAYAATARLAGAEPLYYTLSEESGWLPDPDKLNQMDLKGVKLMWINYPHMPTGAQAPKEAFRWLIEFAKANKILLVNDNPYSLVLNTAEPMSLMRFQGAMECCLELNSLSKSHNMAGWRVGMVIGRPDYLDTVLTVKSNLDSGMFLPVQHAAVQALRNSEEWHSQRNEVYRQRKVLVHELLDMLKCRYQPKTPGMFVWARVPDTIADVEAWLDKILYEAGVFLTPGKVFGSQGERYVRVSLCAPEASIKQAIERISNFISIQ
jgi:LL-diaminopimelate aminotransferase